MPLHVSVIGGPVGVGKTSVLNAIKACTEYMANVEVIVENIDAWQYYLEKFYRAPLEYAFLFQKEVEVHFHNLTKRLEQLAEVHDTDDYFVFVERCPMEVVHVFLELNRERMRPELFTCLRDSMMVYANRPVWTTAKNHLLHCSPATALKRIVQRGRPGEEEISEDHLERLHALYESLMGSFMVHETGRNQFTLRLVTELTKDIV